MDRDELLSDLSIEISVSDGWLTVSLRSSTSFPSVVSESSISLDDLTKALAERAAAQGVNND